MPRCRSDTRLANSNVLRGDAGREGRARRRGQRSGRLSTRVRRGSRRPHSSRSDLIFNNCYSHIIIIIIIIIIITITVIIIIIAIISIIVWLVLTGRSDHGIVQSVGSTAPARLCIQQSGTRCAAELTYLPYSTPL